MTVRDAEQQLGARVRLLAEGIGRVLAIALIAGLNVGGWMVVFSGPWRIGLWIVLLSAGIAAVVLWDASERRA